MHACTHVATPARHRRVPGVHTPHSRGRCRRADVTVSNLTSGLSVIAIEAPSVFDSCSLGGSAVRDPLFPDAPTTPAPGVVLIMDTDVLVLNSTVTPRFSWNEFVARGSARVFVDGAAEVVAGDSAERQAADAADAGANLTGIATEFAALQEVRLRWGAPAAPGLYLAVFAVQRTRQRVTADSGTAALSRRHRVPHGPSERARSTAAAGRVRSMSVARPPCRAVSAAVHESAGMLKPGDGGRWPEGHGHPVRMPRR